MNKGFTLIEMVVAVAIFTLLVGATSGVFVSSIKNQKHGLATQEILDQTSYLMEYISRALRMAVKDDISSGGVVKNCLSGSRVNYEFDAINQCLNFRNYQNECQQFCLEGTRLKDENGDYLTSESLQVSDFSVILSGERQLPFDSLQPRVTISLNITGREQSSVKIQTTISQRNLDVRR
ncbi:MAG: prepilin-type N-terminal cleavage/methylation domain-containing protein [Candidatus Nealsonbacteria bacterium]